MKKAAAASASVCFLGWLVSRLFQQFEAVYLALYYCTVFGNIYVILRCAFPVSLHKTFASVKACIADNMKCIAACLAAVVVGFGVEAVEAVVHSEQMMWPQGAFWALAALAGTLCIFLYRKKDSFVENAFLCIALTAGIYMAVFMPVTTNITWDDQIHFPYTLQLVQGEIVSDADLAMAAITIPRTFSVSQAQADWKYLSEMTSNVTPIPPIWGVEIAAYQWAGYLFNGIGLWIGQILHLSYGATFVLGRISGAVLYAFVIYEAMKRLDGGKLLLAIIALLPTCMFQASNYTYDAWIMCLIAYAYACYVGILQKKDRFFTYRDIIPILIVLSFAIAPKGVYFPIILLLLITPAQRFENPKRYRQFMGLVICTSAICFAVYMLFPFLGGKYPGDWRFKGEISSIGQLVYILTHPIAYLNLLLEFLRVYLSPENFYLYSSSFAYLDGKDYHTVLFSLMFAASIVDRTENDRNYDLARVKLGAAGISFMTAAMIASVLYLSCSPVGANVIQGCQPRYLLPLLFPFFLLVCNFSQFTCSKRERINLFLLAIGGYVLFSDIWVSIAGQYVP